MKIIINIFKKFIQIHVYHKQVSIIEINVFLIILIIMIDVSIK